MRNTFHTRKRDTEVRPFVLRALADFELMHAFGERTAVEREECLRWIEIAPTSDEQEQRVSQLLDDLYQGSPLTGSVRS